MPSRPAPVRSLPVRQGPQLTATRPGARPETAYNCRFDMPPALQASNRIRNASISSMTPGAIANSLGLDAADDCSNLAGAGDVALRLGEAKRFVGVADGSRTVAEHGRRLRRIDEAVHPDIRELDGFQRFDKPGDQVRSLRPTARGLQPSSRSENP